MTKISFAMRHLLLLISILLCLSVSQTQDISEVSQECVVGDDGECTVEEDTTKNGTDNAPYKLESVLPCTDNHMKCNEWARMQECEKNPNYMLHNCVKSCGTCGKTKEEILVLVEEALNQPQEGKLKAKVASLDLGVEQKLPESKQTIRDRGIHTWHEATPAYMERYFLNDPKYDDVAHLCQNKHEMCTEWAALGECGANPNYMLSSCRLACRMCHHLLFDVRCPYDGSTEGNVWKTGDLNAMFERVVTDEYYKKYSPQVLSSPETGGPWLIVIENFLSDEESERLVELGEEQGYERSVDVGEEQEDGSFGSEESDKRTSSNAWCLEECYEDEVTQNVIKRIENVTGIPDANSEYLQILEYEVGEFYGQHHDYTYHTVDRAEGVRLLTFFMYLNDVEEGGETDFPEINLRVTPKRGRAVLWPSVLNDDPNAIDKRTDHQAMPVKKGIKYAINAWVHMRDFKEVFARNCVH